EHVIALKPRGKGLIGTTLRYPYEVRKEEDYFNEIPDEKVTKDMLELATHIVKTKAGHFHPEKFDDRYEDALKDLVKRKQHGQKIEVPKGPEPAKVINLMDALRKSAKGDTGTHRRAAAGRATHARAAKKSGRSHARHRKAG